MKKVKILSKEDKIENIESLMRLYYINLSSYDQNTKKIIENMIEIIYERAKFMNISRLVDILLENENFKKLWKKEKVKDFLKFVDKSNREQEKLDNFMRRRIREANISKKYPKFKDPVNLVRYLVSEFWEKEDIVKKLTLIFGTSKLGKKSAWVILFMNKLYDLLDEFEIDYNKDEQI